MYIHIYIYIYFGSLLGPRMIASTYSEAAQSGTEPVRCLITLAQGRLL